MNKEELYAIMCTKSDYAPQYIGQYVCPRGFMCRNIYEAVKFNHYFARCLKEFWEGKDKKSQYELVKV